MDAKALIRSLINGRILPAVVSPTAAPTINVHRALREFIAEEGHGAQADELAEKWAPSLRQHMEERLGAWEALGVPRPMQLLEDESTTYLTWRHPRYGELIGLPALEERFFGMYQWIANCNPQQLLLLGAIVLWMADADPIYITDGPWDGGIDCVGRICTGELRSLCILLQAKASTTPLSRNVVLSEFGKYMALPRLDKYREYMRAIGADKAADGAAVCYMMVTNNEFNWKAREVAASLNILIRSRAQLAYWISKLVDSDGIEALWIAAEGYIKEGLKTNVVPLLDRHLQL